MYDIHNPLTAKCMASNTIPAHFLLNMKSSSFPACFPLTSFAIAFILFDSSAVQSYLSSQIYR